MPRIPNEQVEYDPSGFFAALIDEMVRERAGILERAVAEAMEHGTYGVLALHCPDGTFMANEHPQVPYGNLYEAPTDATTQEELVAAFTSWHPRE